MSNIPSSFDKGPEELEELSVGQRIKRHCKEQPLVPIGALLTTGAVIMAAQNVRVGNRMKAQYYFRWRVGLQAATLAALVAGSFLYGKTYGEDKSKSDIMREKAKKREQLWIQELENREKAIQDRKKRAEQARLKTQENESSIKKLEAELKDLEDKLKPEKK